MPDISHSFGSDISFGASGDLLVSDGTQETKERVIRRLLTNPGEYIWIPNYGAGLAQFIGRTTSPTQIAAVIRLQMQLEPSVSQTPSPSVVVTVNPDGSVFADITYVDAPSAQQVTISNILLLSPTA